LASTVGTSTLPHVAAFLNGPIDLPNARQQHQLIMAFISSNIQRRLKPASASATIGNEVVDVAFVTSVNAFGVLNLIGGGRC
jgi:hypothetical protein